ncbi:MAG TPA: hypothetical protein VH475_26510 [Tepidisphaeraceae bacterium]|jgi:hypothetical protein
MSVGPQDGVVQFIQAADPADPGQHVMPLSYPSSVAPKRPVLPGMWWLDTSSMPFRLRRRNDANTAWDPIGASPMASYVTQRPSNELTNEQALSTLPTGVLKSTTGTGLLSIATGNDLPSHAHPVPAHTHPPSEIVGFDPAVRALAKSEILLAIRRVTSDTTMLPDDEVIIVDAGGPATVRLVPASGRIGALLTVCRHSPNGSVTVLADGGDRLWGPGANGVASQALSSRGAFLTLLGETATTWRVLNSGGNVQLLDLPVVEQLPSA